MEDNTFGTILKTERTKLALSIPALSKLSAISASEIRNIENEYVKPLASTQTLLIEALKAEEKRQNLQSSITGNIDWICQAPCSLSDKLLLIKFLRTIPTLSEADKHHIRTLLKI